MEDNLKLKNKAKTLVDVSKRKGKIKSYKEAFKDFPSNKEAHKGKDDYYLENR